MGQRVLVIGLDPRRVPGPWDPEPVVAAIAAGMAGLADAGYDAASCLVGLRPEDDVEGPVAAGLRGQPWDCVVVGGGLRTEEDLVAVFERIVNLVHRLAPTAAIGFNARPDDLVGTVRRAVSPVTPP